MEHSEGRDNSRKPSIAPELSMGKKCSLAMLIKK
jgi:hypothetical protein